MESDLKVIERIPVKGGTQLLTLSNGLQCIFKDASSQSEGSLRRDLEPGKELSRERAAYQVDKAMGHYGRIPPVVERTIDGQTGNLMIYIPDASPGRIKARNTPLWVELDRNLGHPEGYRRIAVLDNVLGNLDRHQDNWLINRDGWHQPIDHGLTFPPAEGFINYNFGIPKNLTEADRDALKKLLASQQTLTPENLGLEPSAISAMLKRVQVMLESGSTCPAWWQKDGTFCR